VRPPTPAKTAARVERTRARIYYDGGAAARPARDGHLIEITSPIIARPDRGPPPTPDFSKSVTYYAFIRAPAFAR